MNDDDFNRMFIHFSPKIKELYRQSTSPIVHSIITNLIKLGQSPCPKDVLIDVLLTNLIRYEEDIIKLKLEKASNPPKYIITTQDNIDKLKADLQEKDHPKH